MATTLYLTDGTTLDVTLYLTSEIVGTYIDMTNDNTYYIYAPISNTDIITSTDVTTNTVTWPTLTAVTVPVPQTTDLPTGSPFEPITKIKPSEALRLGRLTRPRGVIGRYFEGEDGACALGAIMAGYGYSLTSYNDFFQWFTHKFGHQAAVILGVIPEKYDAGETDEMIIAYLNEHGL